MKIVSESEKKFLLDNIDAIGGKNVHKIRELAKALGAPKPTATKKEDNMDGIKAILKGEMEPKYPKSNSDKHYAEYRATVSRWLDELKEDEMPLCDDITPQGVAAPEQSLESDAFEIEGRLEIIEKGYGFLRTSPDSVTKGADIFVDGKIIQHFRLCGGDVVCGLARKEDPYKSAKLIKLTRVNGISAEKENFAGRPRFEELKAVFPNKRLRLEGCGKFDFALRAIDLVAPIGRGQRGLIVSPPKAGKTTLLKQIAQALLHNYSDLTVIMLLIDERPEEVTDMEREVKGCEIVSSTFDQEQEHHVKVAEQTLARAKRLVEMGGDVVILLDSITRLARAYNQVGEASGRTLSGGLDVAALKEPKRFFGAARNTDGHGSLTIIATALINTGSRMDDVIYEEFKGTGNMEIHLDRKLSERRIFPAIDLEKSGTRREDLLYTGREMTAMWAVRRMLSKADNGESAEMILDMLTKTKTNDELLTLLEISMQKSGK